MDVRKFICAFDINAKFSKEDPTIIAQGLVGSVYFYTEEILPRYRIVFPNIEDIKSLPINKIKALLPKFGKYEIEDFFSIPFLTALLVTSDMTNIMNTSVLCYDGMWSTKIYSKTVRNIFLNNCFSIVGQTDKEIELRLNI